jgi:hypothetical protein
MPKAYSDAEQTATAAYNAELDRLRAQRDEQIKTLVSGRKNELDLARAAYDSELVTALQKVSLNAGEAVPACAAIERVLHTVESCSTSYTIGKKTPLSPGFQALLASERLSGPFDVKGFRAAGTPGKISLGSALRAVPLSTYQAIPEFTKPLDKILKKERDKRKLDITSPMPEDAAQEVVAKFVTEWDEATRKYKNDILYGGGAIEKFGGIPIDIIPFSLDQMELVSKNKVKAAGESVLQRYVVAKDSINSKYDSLQRKADAEMRSGTAAAESVRTAAIDGAAQRFPPLQQTSTSLQGEATLRVPPSGGFLYAEDTATDRHLRWAIPLNWKTAPATLEITDANAIRATPEATASIASSKVFPKAEGMTSTDRAEYNLRYGSRLIKTWQTQARLHDASVSGDELLLSDTPFGFSFTVMATSDNVFNTLRMNDNDIASRFFKEIIAPYLQGVPTDLKSTGGSDSFQAVKVSILGSKKSFTDEYAIGSHFWLNYVFRIEDIESFASQKIDAQQLLDRAHISQDGVGRISVKLVSGQ